MQTVQNQPPSDEMLQGLLADFDVYSQNLLAAVDGGLDATKCMGSVEYTTFLYGAALAIVRGYRQQDAISAVILVPYLSRFMGAERAMRWLLACEREALNSTRLQGVHAAGNNTAQAVVFAATQGRPQLLNTDRTSELLFRIFSELRRLMVDSDAPDQALFVASGELCDSVLGA